MGVDAPLICVECGADLPDLAGCGACGRVYQAQDGVPSMFPTRALTFSVGLPPTATNPMEIDRSVYVAPERVGQAGTGVYHFDRAHSDILETLPKDALVLETGCGGAQLRTWCKDHGLRYLGTDVATERVHGWLQEHGGADLFCDAHCLPLADASVDAVYASAVYEHLAFPHLAAAEAARVLKPGGWFLGSMSFLEPWHDESYSHMTPNGVHGFVTMAGLVPRFIWPEDAWPGFVALLKMGNKATKPLGAFGKLMNAWYLAPKRLQDKLKGGDAAEMYEARARMSGAIAWIAQKPEVTA